MPKDGRVHLEISDIFDERQEAEVIRVLHGQVPESDEDLHSLFASTDTYLVRGLTQQKAEAFAEDLGGFELSFRIIDQDTDDGDEEAAEEPGAIVCPECGCVLDEPDWRCPECYYEYPDYEYRGDTS